MTEDLRAPCGVKRVRISSPTDVTAAGEFLSTSQDNLELSQQQARRKLLSQRLSNIQARHNSSPGKSHSSSTLPEHELQGRPSQSRTRLPRLTFSFGGHADLNAPSDLTPRNAVPGAVSPIIYHPPSSSINPSLPTIDPTPFYLGHNANYPEGAPTVTWVGDKIKTALPYIPDPEDSSINLLKHDENHVRVLAQTAILESKCVKYLTYQTFQHDIDAAAAITDKLKLGIVVVLKDYPFLAASVDVTSLSRCFHFLGTEPVVVSDAVVRVTDSTHPHLFMSLADFCTGIHDNTRVQCILDAPTLDGERPPLIKFLDDGHTAYIRKHNHYSVRQNVHLDVQKSCSWILIHQGMYHTYAHHDANGYVTWIQVLSGFKIWVIIQPAKNRTDQTRRDLVTTGDKLMIAEPNENGFYRTETERTIIFAGPGDFIIMPPGTFHEVYTPVPSVTLGGHLYSYNALHLTELALSLDKGTNEKFTNQSHPSTIATIQSMMAVLPTIKDRVLHRKPLAALCRMVLHPTQYASQSVDADLVVLNHTSKKPKKDFIDVADAKRLARNLVTKLKLPQDVQHPLRKVIKTDFIFGGAGFNDPEEVVEWAKHVQDLPFEPAMF